MGHPVGWFSNSARNVKSAMWIKICGNTNHDDALLAAEAGADALGFVFAESQRKVSIEDVQAIVPALPHSLETYGVFVDADFETMVNAVLECGLSGVQLHGAVAPGLVRRLREYFDRSLSTRPLKILRAVHYSSALDSELAAMHSDTLPYSDVPDTVLVDSRTAQAVGGTGVSFDWQAAQETFLRHAPHLNMAVAGGLTPNNVSKAIVTLKPWGVDVVTGVESSPGKKDPKRVRGFIEQARIAAARTNQER